MPIVGTVTRTNNSLFFSQSQGNVGDAGGNAYTLRTAAGIDLGGYQSVAQAQAAFRQFHGPNRIARWERADLRGDIEQHIAIGLPLDPSEIYGTVQLVQWLEPDAVLGSVQLSNVTTGRVRQVNDLSGTDNFARQLVAADQPTVLSNTAYKGRTTLDFDSAGPQDLDVPNLVLVPPYTIYAVASADTSSGGESLYLLTSAIDDLIVGDDGAGSWVMTVGAASVGGPAIVLGAPTILTVRATATLTEFFVNGVSQGTTATVTDANGVLSIGLAPVPWDGRLAALVIAENADLDGAKLSQTERYLGDRYQ